MSLLGGTAALAGSNMKTLGPGLCIHHQSTHALKESDGIPYHNYSSKFSRSNNFMIFVRCKLITKFLSTKNFTPMGLLEQQ